MLISVINKSSRVVNADVKTMCDALTIQMNEHVAPSWGSLPATISFYADETKAPVGSYIISVIDQPDVDGALGYHTINGDKIDGFVFVNPVLDNKGVVLYDETNPQNVSVASVLSHEVVETFGDRYCSFWSDGPIVQTQDGKQYSAYALELADAVEGDSYVVMVGTIPVSVSNFLTPAWFNPQATPSDGPFDYMKRLTSSYAMTSGGYIVVRGSTDSTQLFGEHMPTWKQEAKRHAFSRSSKR